MFARRPASALAQRCTAINTLPLRMASKTKSKPHPFMQFFANATYFRTGRPWSVAELRIKSNEDLEKLWFVLLKERNALSTYQLYCRQQRVPMRNKLRIQKCKQSMSAIKHVVTERSNILKVISYDKSFTHKQHFKRQNRRLERWTTKLENSNTKTTPNQQQHIPIQCKTWRRKTQGQGLLSRKRVVADQAAV